MNKTPTCCEQESVWVENVPGKGYNYCRKCKSEVATPVRLETNIEWDDQLSQAFRDLYRFS